MAGPGGVGEWGHKDSARVAWHLVGLAAGSQFRLSGLLQEKVLVCEKPVVEMVSSRCVCTGIML